MIPFTQFMLPDGRKKETGVERPEEVEKKAHELIESGFKFEIEVLRTGEINMDCSRPEDDMPISQQICSNESEDVKNAVDALVNESYQSYFQK